MIKPYYEEPGIQIFLGDCLEIMPQLEPVDLVLTDPPYVGLKGGVNFDKLPHGVAGRDESFSVGDLWGASLNWVPVAWDLCQKGMLAFCSFHFVDELGLSLKSYKLALITWHKRSSPPSINNVPHYSTEFIWVFKKQPGLTWRKLKTFYNILGLSAGCVSTGERITKNKKSVHPTQKPLALFRQLLLINPNTILDPFMGTGTTLVAAKELGRKCIGIEIEQKYCDIAIDRLRQGVFNFQEGQTVNDKRNRS